MFYTNTYTHVWVHKCTCIVFKRGTVWKNNALYFSYYVRHAITARLPLNLLTLNRLNGCRVEPILSAIALWIRAPLKGSSARVEAKAADSSNKSKNSRMLWYRREVLLKSRGNAVPTIKRKSDCYFQRRWKSPERATAAERATATKKKRKKLTVGDDALGWGEGRCLNCIRGTKLRKNAIDRLCQRWGESKRDGAALNAIFERDTNSNEIRKTLLWDGATSTKIKEQTTE